MQLDANSATRTCGGGYYLRAPNETAAVSALGKSLCSNATTALFLPAKQRKNNSKPRVTACGSPLQRAMFMTIEAKKQDVLERELFAHLVHISAGVLESNEIEAMLAFKLCSKPPNTLPNRRVSVSATQLRQRDGPQIAALTIFLQVRETSSLLQF